MAHSRQGCHALTERSGLDLKAKEHLMIRHAQAGDGGALASLADQLGYPMLNSDAERQLSSLAKEEGHAVFVAELGDHGIVGWIHLMPRQLLYVPRLAEIGGLVVDAEHRRKGIGRALIHAAEQWAKGQGYSRIVVRSNAVRKESHAFYPDLGYPGVKTQKVYRKELNGQQSVAQRRGKPRARTLSL
jgi:GNAT superfamily N-acetyltransferase